MAHAGTVMGTGVLATANGSVHVRARGGTSIPSTRLCWNGAMTTAVMDRAVTKWQIYLSFDRSGLE